MTLPEQVVLISAGATSFTVVCALCAELDAAAGTAGSTFAGRLDPDLDHGMFLCRRGHSVRIEREPAAAAHDGASAAA